MQQLLLCYNQSTYHPFYVELTLEMQGTPPAGDYEPAVQMVCHQNNAHRRGLSPGPSSSACCSVYTT
jgi:hypothetical protein